MTELNPFFTKATTISDCWFTAVYNVLEYGRRFVIDKGSYEGQTRLEFDYFFGNILYPCQEPILPVMPEGCNIPAPVEHAYVYGGEGYDRSYIEYLMTGHKAEGEQYTYGERLCTVYNPAIKDPSQYKRYTMNQIDQIIFVYKEYGHRNNQMVLQIAQPSDIFLDDPPCLRHIDTRIQDNRLHFFVYFRSWDLWGGFPANLAGIATLQEHMAGEIGVDVGQMFVESKGLHLYGYAEDLAKIRTMRECQV